MRKRVLHNASYVTLVCDNFPVLSQNPRSFEATAQYRATFESAYIQWLVWLVWLGNEECSVHARCQVLDLYIQWLGWRLFQLMQYTRLLQVFLAHRGALMTKTDFNFLAFCKLQILQFNSAFPATSISHKKRRSIQV